MDRRYLPTVTRGPCPQTAPWWQATVGSWTGHHGHVGARLHRRRWWPGAAAATVLVFVYGLYGLCGVSDASGSPTSVGAPTHPQILTCAEEATQFTGTLPPIGPHDIGFGPGYFPHARLLATMNPPNSSRGAQLTGYKLPPVVYPGATVTMTIARGARSYVVQQNPWSPRQGSLSVTYRACLHKRGFFPQSFRFTDGRRRGCVPLDVRVDGQRKTSHIVLSFFAGPCRTST
jgi:hypothetical protein